MSVLRKLVVTALVAGAVAAVPATALASPARPAATASAAHSASASPATIHQVRCRSNTFNVYSRSRGEICFEGLGTIRPNIPIVYAISTGENTGNARLERLNGTSPLFFHRHTKILISPVAELVYLHIISD